MGKIPVKCQTLYGEIGQKMGLVWCMIKKYAKQ